MTQSDIIEGNSEIIEKLKLPVLRDFEDPEIQDFLSISKVYKYKAGECIIEEGLFDNVVYYMVSGQVQIIKKGKELITLRRTGDVFGEMGVITGSIRSASVVAKQDTVCLALDIRKLEAFSKNEKLVFRYMLYRAFAEILANRLKFTTEELMKAKDEIERVEK
ncbi:MAG: cyclic nucleotide-binding domain-containing protein [Desulfobacterales bacterium]